MITRFPRAHALGAGWLKRGVGCQVAEDYPATTVAGWNGCRKHGRELAGAGKRFWETCRISAKLSSVVSDLMGASGRLIVEALIEGRDSPEILSWKVRGGLQFT